MQNLATLRAAGLCHLKRLSPINSSSTYYRPFSSSVSDYSNQSRGGLPRFFSQNLPSSKGEVVRVDGDEFWHMTKVLRLKEDDRVQLFDGKGGLVEGKLQKIARAEGEFMALENPVKIHPRSTQWHVCAAFGTLKGGRSDWLVEKCTELGACGITPLLTERSSTISENRVERLERVILAAAKQSQRLHEMKLNPPLKIDGLVHLVAESKQSFVATAEATPLVDVLTSTRTESSGLIIIGPEGDLTEREVKLIIEAGATPVGLGPHRLRVETATMALLATLMLWSDARHIDNSCE